MNLLMLFGKAWKQSQPGFSDLSVHTKQGNTLSIFIFTRRDNQLNDIETELNAVFS